MEEAEQDENLRPRSQKRTLRRERIKENVMVNYASGPKY